MKKFSKADSQSRGQVFTSLLGLVTKISKRAWRASCVGFSVRFPRSINLSNSFSTEVLHKEKDCYRLWLPRPFFRLCFVFSQTSWSVKNWQTKNPDSVHSDRALICKLWFVFVLDSWYSYSNQPGSKSLKQRERFNPSLISPHWPCIQEHSIHYS